MTFAHANNLDLPPPNLSISHNCKTRQITTNCSKYYQEQEMPIPPTIKNVTYHDYKKIL